MSRNNLSKSLVGLAAAVAASALCGTAFAADLPEIVVEAAAPVHVENTGKGMPGGASVEILSVKYNVHTGNLDLTKHDDVLALDRLIQSAAKKGCDDIGARYPARTMSDAKACVDEAVKGAAAREKELIAAASKRTTK